MRTVESVRWEMCDLKLFSIGKSWRKPVIFVDVEGNILDFFLIGPEVYECRAKKKGEVFGLGDGIERSELILVC